jgi:hypothetical protein
MSDFLQFIGTRGFVSCVIARGREGRYFPIIAFCYGRITHRTCAISIDWHLLSSGTANYLFIDVHLIDGNCHEINTDYMNLVPAY